MQKLLEVAKQKGHPDIEVVYFPDGNITNFQSWKDDITVVGIRI